MKAVQINSYGESSVLEINTNAPKPSPKQGQVLVEIHAASLNPIDWKIRAGYLQKMAPLTFPVTMGGDFAGVVIYIGAGVSNLSVGDAVYGSAIILNGGSGSFAELVAANAANTAVKPKSTDFTQAGALPLVGVSAIQALEEHVKLQSGQKILVHGGAGGIGSMAIQLAKSHSAYVATTVNTNDKEFVKELGADEVIDYKTQQFEELLKDFDAVYDTVGGETTTKSFVTLKKGGIIVSMLGQPDQTLAQKYGVRTVGQNTQVTTAHLQRLSELVDSGKMKVRIDKTFPLEKVEEAFIYLEKIHPRGKVVLKIKD